MFYLRAQRHRLVLSPDSANCGAGGQKRLPLRRTLWAYRSLGLDALRLIHMKCGFEVLVGSSIPPQFFLRKNRWLYPINRPTGEVRPETRLRLDARRISHSVAGCKQDTTQSDETGDRGVPGGVFTRPQAGAYEANRRVAAALRPSGLLCRRGQSNPRRSAEYPLRRSRKKPGVGRAGPQKIESGARSPAKRV